MGCIKRLRGVAGRFAAVFLAVRGGKRLVGGVVQVGRIRHVGDGAQRVLLQGGQGRAVDGVHRQQRDLAEQAGLAVLLDEVHAHAAGKEHVGGIRLGVGQRGQLHRIVGLVHLGEHLVHHVALVEALEPGHGVLAGLVVGRQQVDLLESHLVGHLAAAFVALRVVP
ncbi:hypothetical protein D3C87_1584190 [compost metagenome]